MDVPAELIPPFVLTVWETQAGERHVYVHANVPGVTSRAVLVALGDVIGQVAAMDPTQVIPPGAPQIPAILKASIDAHVAANVNTGDTEPVVAPS